MRIQIIHKGRRNQLVCERRDGTVEIADLGPKLPFHDLAHYVVERRLKLRRGFYGNIYNGLTVAQLSDKAVIQTLPLDSAVAEVVTRALQSLGAGACTVGQFPDLIQGEFALYGIHFPLGLEENEIEEMLAEYQGLVEKWTGLIEGEGLMMELPLEEKNVGDGNMQ